MYIARVLALTGFAICAPSIGHAQTVTETITKWGLLGSWSIDCSARATDAGSSHLAYQIREGKPVQIRNMGKDGDDVSVISRATIGPDGSLEVRIEREGGRRSDIVFVRGPNRQIRAKVNRQADGTYIIRDAKFVSNGTPTKWQTRCQ